MSLCLEQLTWPLLLDSMSEAVWLVDADSLQILHANRAACHLTQLPAERMVGETVHVLASTPQDLFRWNEPIEPLNSGLETYTQLLRQDGCLVPVVQRIQLLMPGLLLLAMSDRSEQAGNERELENLLAELRATLDSAADGMLVCGIDGSIRAFNHKLAEMWAMPDELLVRRNDEAVLDHMAVQVRDAAQYHEAFARMSMLSHSTRQDVLHTVNERVVERRSVPLLCRGAVVGRIFSFRDITQEAQVQAGLQLAAQVFDSSLDAIFITDGQGVLIRGNPALARLCMNTLPQGIRAFSLFEGADEAAWHHSVNSAWRTQNFWEGTRNLLRPGADPCVVRVSWVVLRDPSGAITQSIGFLRDLTQQNQDQQRIEQLAYTDALTGLPNRLLLSQHVAQIIQADPEGQQRFSILFLDLDRFKIINDSLGHQFGDRVLQLVSERLKACLRPMDMLCRLGGDEFVVYLGKCGESQAAKVAQRILQEMDQPFLLDGMGFSVQCSIGIAQYPEHGRTLDDLIKQADTAMYRVKEAGKGNYRFYAPEMSSGLLGRVQMEHALRHALERGHMQVYYQPLVDIRSGCIVGAEALARWTDPELGVVSPANFIPLAEESGFIVQLGAWVMEQAIGEAARWLQAGMPARVSVNVSALEMRQTGFVQHVQDLLAQYALPAQWLELELTETILLQQVEEMAGSITQLAAMGVGLAIDDFGTGYSNLAYLKSLPISKLKIDKSFVQGLPHDDSDLAIVQAVLGLGRALKVVVLAEGVETPIQRDTLASMGCDCYQGYLCAPALEPKRFVGLLSQMQHTTL